MAREELLSREQLALLRRLVRALYTRLGSQQRVADTTGLAQQTGLGDYPHGNDVVLVSGFAETTLHSSGVRPRRLAPRDHVERKSKQERNRKR